MISCICYKQFHPLGFQVSALNLGKGEVESSILSCSTIFTNRNNGLVTVLVRHLFAARQNMARTERDLAPLRVQNACKGFWRDREMTDNYDEDRHAEINDTLDVIARHLQEMQQALLRAMREDDAELWESRARQAAERAISRINDLLP